MLVAFTNQSVGIEEHNLEHEVNFSDSALIYHYPSLHKNI
jgi:hypothetical protein